MASLLSVMAGGAIGAALRFSLSRWFAPGSAMAWPWATMVANLVGALAMGALAGWSERHAPSANLRAFLAPGLLGGFTTFSAFSLETAAMLEGGRSLAALGYATLSVAGSVALLFAGLALGRAA